jgi:asparagine synthase (glutamine-hydrolysing)
MCGIVGLINGNGMLVNPDVIMRMTNAIIHRGPTDGGTIVHGSIALGNRRLAIIDLEGGMQPLCNEDGKIWITYNGEIYNFLKIKQELVEKGHQFKTISDTEMVVHAYEEWGVKCVEQFRGMFAFAILDHRKNQIFLARDQLGIKPLYYLENPGIFAFSSEIEAFHTIPDLRLTIDLEAIDQYFWIQYIPAPKSIFREIKKLPPANRMIVNLDDLSLKAEEYWNLEFEPDIHICEQEWIEAIDFEIRESVRAHLISDVPFGAFLSGGIDSSAVVAYMSQILNKPVRTFSIGFEEKEFNELAYAKVVSDRWKTEHKVQIIRPDALGILPALVKHYGEPFGDSSAIPTYYVSQLAQENVPMVLSGDGGDESFGGYNSYVEWMRRLDGRGTPIWKRILRPVASFFLPVRYPPMKASLENWLHFIQYLNKDQRNSLWRKEYKYVIQGKLEMFNREYEKAKTYSRLSTVQYMDIKTYLPYDILTKVDIASMMHGLEVRTPLVDIRVMEFAAKIPPYHLIKPNINNIWSGKQIVKKALEKYYPIEFLNRPKMGFSIPAVKWFSSEGILSEYIFDRILNPRSHLFEFFNFDAVQNLMAMKDFRSSWFFLFLDEWLNQNYQRFIIN